MKDPKEFPCTDSRPSNNGTGGYREWDFDYLREYGFGNKKSEREELDDIEIENENNDWEE